MTGTTQQPGTGRMGTGGRIGRGLLALLALLVGLAGIPWLLLWLAGNPIPTGISADGLWRALLRPDDGSMLIGLVTLVAWVAWLIFALSVLAELVTIVSRRRIRVRLPGLGGAQRVAGALILLVLAVFVVPHPLALAQPTMVDQAGLPGPSVPVASAAPQRPGPDVSVAADHDDPEATAANSSRATAADTTESAGAQLTVHHRVRAGDDLWSLAEHYYGSGQDWRRIAAANPDLLTGGPDRLEPGWTLRIPAVTGHSSEVRVREGDSLSSIARRAYGDADQWTRIFRANTDQIDDPDVIVTGATLRVPAQDSHSARPRDTTPSDGSSSAAPKPSSAPKPSGTETSNGAETSPVTEPEPAPDGGAVVDDAPVAPSDPDPAGRSDRASGQPSALPVHGTLAAAQAVQVTGVGAVLAAALVGGLLVRRQIQLRARPVGRRIPHPSAAAQQLETKLGVGADPLAVEQLDLALRAIGRFCRQEARSVPGLVLARMSAEAITLTMTEPDLPAPTGFTVDGVRWQLTAGDVGYLIQDPALADCADPYPALVALGTDATGSTVMINLEEARVLNLDARPIGTAVGGVGAAITAELAMGHWSDEVMVTVVGGGSDLAAAIDRYNVTAVDDLDALLQGWEQRAARQRRHLLGRDRSPSPADLRIDPDLADPWLPEVAVIMQQPDRDQSERLRALLADGPAVSLAAVLVTDDPVTDWTVDYVDLGDDGIGGELAPLGWRFAAQALDDSTTSLVEQLIACTGREDTEPAPWWAADFPAGTHYPARARSVPTAVPEIGQQPDSDLGDASPADDAEPLLEVAGSAPLAAISEVDQSFDGQQPHHRAGIVDAAHRWPSAAATRSPVDDLDPVAASDAAWAWLPAVDRPQLPDPASEETVIVPSPFAHSRAADGPPAPLHPTIMLLGPIEMLGATGAPPSRATLQCIEYATWLMEHPATTAPAMAGALMVAEGTRRSNMSRLRNWLGSDEQGEPYLPDAYSGRITLSPLVSSDWHRLQILTTGGVNRTDTDRLCRALDLVRGAPLADAAPSQWLWAEEIRTDMASVVRDIGVELTDRALADGDLDLARWAASRSLTASPQDEFLIGARIRTEHQAGNPAEVERLALQLAAHARTLGVDLHPDTVDLLQQVVEGRIRARA